jgi:hypothetical protein
MTRYPWFPNALWALAATIVAGLLVGDLLAVQLVVSVTSIFVLGFWGLLLTLCFVGAVLSNRNLLQTFKEQFLHWVSAAFLSFVFLSCGYLKTNWQERQARNFVAVASNQLDQKSGKAKRFPTKLPPDLEAWKPEIVRYYSEGKRYDFSYSLPSDVGTSYHYSNQTRIWEKRSTWND